MKKIVLSFATIALVAAVAIGATTAYFSDTETSTGNTFTAGDIDLKIDSECHYYQNGVDIGCVDAAGVEFGNWEETDLGAEKFFAFDDIKPGDWGENTISMHVYSNDAWGRVLLTKTTDLDNTCTEPELEDEVDCGEDNDGELDDNMEAMIWLDEGVTDGFQGKGQDVGEGDNIHQEGEPILTESISDDLMIDLRRLLVGDATGLTADGHMVGSVTYYFGVGWCFGDWDHTNMTCDGSVVDNTPQTDSLGGNITFEVEQYRNNPAPTWTVPTP